MVNVCQPGSNLLSAGYCMYSSSCILVVSIGKGVRRERTFATDGLRTLSCTRCNPARATLTPCRARPLRAHQVFGFTLDQNVGEFVLSHDNIKIPDSGKIYSFNEGNYAMWTPGLKKYMDSLKARSGRASSPSCAAARAQALTRCRAPLAGWRQEGGWQGVQRALHRLAGGRLPPHHAVRRHLRCVGAATLCSFV